VIAVSGCVISFNEEDRIRSCLESLVFCDELLVLDSGSTDRTRDIAEACGARVEIQPFLGHRRQKQRAVELAKHDWVCCLDCDEQISPELRAEIESHLADEPDETTIGYSAPRSNTYLGKPMRHGLFWPDRKLRVFHRGRAAWRGTDPHDRVEPLVAGAVVDLGGPIHHDSYRSFSEHERTVRRFASIAAEAMAREGRTAGPLSPWTRGLAALLKCLVVKSGWLDGWRGILASWMSAKYDFLKYRQLRRGKGVA